jgi:hypothetical protein
MHRLREGVRAIVWVVLLAGTATADTFVWVDDSEQTQSIEGVLVASGRGVHVVAQPDGQYRLIPQERLQQRVPGEDPQAVSPAAMGRVLREKFGRERLRVHVEDPYVIGLVLAAPLPAEAEARADNFLRRARGFLHNVETVFSRFCRELRIPSERPQFPLVLLVFETDSDFDAYAREVAGGPGLAAENMAGFYSPLTNWLAIRIGECRSYQVPLHEAIHQQVYNRGLLQRLAGVPVWFNEGIATGFENDGERINIGPTRINTTYARQVPRADALSWDEVFADDRVFHGDVLSGEAYVHAWSMHWLLVTQHRRAYARYVRLLGRIEPLAEPTAEERQALFQEVFGISIADLQAEFPRLLEAAARRQKIRLEPPPPAPNLTHADASQVELTSVEYGEDGQLRVRGELCNVSPFREFAYYVWVCTDGGLYADWHLPCVGSLATEILATRPVSKQIPGGPGNLGRHVWIEVQCTLPDSEEAAQWRRGDYPRPGWAE